MGDSPLKQTKATATHDGRSSVRLPGLRYAQSGSSSDVSLNLSTTQATTVNNPVNEKNPLLAPFAKQSSKSSAPSSPGPMYNSLFNRVSMADSSLSLASSQYEARNEPYRNRSRPPTATPSPSQNNTASRPKLKVYDELGGSLSLVSTNQSQFSDQSKSDTKNDTKSLEDSITDLKASLEQNVVAKLNTTDNDLEMKLESIEKALADLQKLRNESIQLIKKFESTTYTTNEEIAEQLSNLISTQVSFDVVSNLESRIANAKSRVEECRGRLTHVNQKVIIQENDNKQRRKRIWYAKQGLFIAFMVAIVMVLLIRYSLHQRYDFPTIIRCLEDLENCNLH